MMQCSMQHLICAHCSKIDGWPTVNCSEPKQNQKERNKLKKKMIEHASTHAFVCLSSLTTRWWYSNSIIIIVVVIRFLHLFYPVYTSDVKQSQNAEAEAKTLEAEVEARNTRPRPRLRLATCRYFCIRTHGDNANNTELNFLSHIRVLNHVFVMNVAMIQPWNGYNQYYFALNSTFSSLS